MSKNRKIKHESYPSTLALSKAAQPEIKIEAKTVKCAISDVAEQDKTIEDMAAEGYEFVETVVVSFAEIGLRFIRRV
jgi:hypothetical protein